MGNNTSSHVLATPLAPQRRFPRVINQRFVLEYAATLRVPFRFWSHQETVPIEIVDHDLGHVMFKISAPRDALAKRMLLDKNGVPVVAMDCYPVGMDYAMYVPHVPMPARRFTGPDDAKPAWPEHHRALCLLQTNTRPLEKRLLIELEDPATRTPLHIKVEGLWQNHEALFWLDRGLTRDRECIARVYVEPEVKQRMKQSQKQRKRSGGDDIEAPALSYCVGIAPGVDVAMIVLACAAMDEELAKKESGKPVEIPTDEVTRMLAQRHHGTGDRNKWRSSTLVTAS